MTTPEDIHEEHTAEAAIRHAGTRVRNQGLANANAADIQLVSTGLVLSKLDELGEAIGELAEVIRHRNGNPNGRFAQVRRVATPGAWTVGGGSLIFLVAERILS